MKTKNLFALWGGCYIFCLLLSFIPTPGDVLQVLLRICAVGFFIPGGWLLYRSLRSNDRVLTLRIRLLSGLSLLLTLLLLIINLLGVTGSETVGNVLHVFLLLVSVPMGISGWWLLSLFGWACLLVASFLKKT